MPKTIVKPEVTVNTFEGFEGKEKTTAKPFAQVVNPKNLDAEEIRDLNIPYGVAITLDNAEAVGFKPDEHWKQIKLAFGGEKQDAYIATNVKMVTVYKSPIEVEKGEFTDAAQQSVGNWKYVGNAYVKGQSNITELGLKATDKNDKLHRTVTRNLVFFLDKDNNALHKEPLSLKTRAVYGATHGIELQNVKKAMGEFFEAATGSKLDYSLYSYVVFNYSVDFEKKGNNAPSTIISSVSFPTSDSSKARTSEEVTRRSSAPGGRKVTLNYVPYSELIISKNSETGQLITQVRETHADFTKSPLGGVPQPVKFESQGTLGEEVGQDGDYVTLGFVSDSGENFTVCFSQEDYGQYKALEGKAVVIKGTTSEGKIYPEFLTEV